MYVIGVPECTTHFIHGLSPFYLYICYSIRSDDSKIFLYFAVHIVAYYRILLLHDNVAAFPTRFIGTQLVKREYIKMLTRQNELSPSALKYVPNIANDNI